MSEGPRIYNLFPLLAGPILRWQGHLDRIGRMGFNWIYLNPIHYPGFSGSLYAVKDPMRLHPLLSEESEGDPFDRLKEFLVEARSRGIRVMIDLVLNHTAKDAPLAEKHPEWFVRTKNGKLVSPSAIDPADARRITVWGDLAELNYQDEAARRGLLAYWDGVVKFHLDLGFDGFRCDAAYKVPFDFWNELITRARNHAAERLPSGERLLFAAETLGCRLEETRSVASAGFDLLFNSSKWWDFRQPWCLEQNEMFRNLAPSISFPESHDTPRLAAESGGRIEIQRLRYLFAAFFSAGIMMPMGYEYGARKNLDVVKTRPDDVERPACDLTAFIGGVNRLKAECPVLNQDARIDWIPPGNPGEGPVVAMYKRSQDRSSEAVMLVNTSEEPADPRLADVLRQVGMDPSAVISSSGMLRHSSLEPESPPGDPEAPLGPMEGRVFCRRG